MTGVINFYSKPYPDGWLPCSIAFREKAGKIVVTEYRSCSEEGDLILLPTKKEALQYARIDLLYLDEHDDLEVGIDG